MGVGQHRHTGKLKPDTAESHGIPLPTTIIIDDGTLDRWCIDPHTWSHCDILKEKMGDHQRQRITTTTTKTTSTTARTWFLGAS